MPALSDRSFNPGAWARLGLVAVGLGVVALAVWATTFWHEDAIEVPRLLDKRFDEAPGRPGSTTTRISKLGAKAVPTLIQDLGSGIVTERQKALELLSTIDDPRVVPALAHGLVDRDLGVRLIALAGLGRTGKAEAAAVLWGLTEAPSELVRYRALVGIGLTGQQPDADRLLRDLPGVIGHERYVQAWAAGRILRRLANPDRQGYLPGAPVPADEAAAAQLQADVDLVHAALDKLESPRQNAILLSERTDVAFATWDQGHQIALQVVAVNGPHAVRRGSAESVVAPPPPSKRGLELRGERVPVAR
ncbi:MAG: HEAT repeat domain-containing protein [Myxococcales bacterium]|nr:HEAT repeat domain-containing protein [Myxococcales bacterium]